jgi:mannose-6-phosphate isomerase-like protein (cupin superfamily)
MKRYRLKDLSDVREGHVFRDILPGAHICNGGMGFKKPGQRTHSFDGAGGSDRHVHDDPEGFVILQGKAEMELNGKRYPLVAGDIVVVEPGEDHHLISDVNDPCINLWLHAGSGRHPDQGGGD